MLIWLASYPRSGNTYLRMVLHKIFGLQTYASNSDERVFSTHPGVIGMVGHKSIDVDEAVIQRARASDQLYVIKTHEPPLTDDPAIYIIRDGRSSVMSYFYYCNEIERLSVSLDDVICGNVYAGSWTEHFYSWLPMHRPNTLLMRYEELIINHASLINQLRDYLGIDPIVHGPMPPFSQLHGLFPHFFRSGDNCKNISEIELSLPLFLEKHGMLMRQLLFIAYRREGRLTCPDPMRCLRLRGTLTGRAGKGVMCASAPPLPRARGMLL
jgi:hypothetical protein